jgi:hypothetical protein
VLFVVSTFVVIRRNIIVVVITPTNALVFEIPRVEAFVDLPVAIGAEQDALVQLGPNRLPGCHPGRDREVLL